MPSEQCTTKYIYPKVDFLLSVSRGGGYHGKYGAWNNAVFTVLSLPCIECGSEGSTNCVRGAGVSCCRISQSWRLVLEMLVKNANWAMGHCPRGVHLLSAMVSVDFLAADWPSAEQASASSTTSVAVPPPGSRQAKTWHFRNVIYFTAGTKEPWFRRQLRLISGSALTNPSRRQWSRPLDRACFRRVD